MRRHTFLLPLFLVGLFAQGCTSESFCAKRQECDPKLTPDSQAVCVESRKGQLAALRANQEPECIKLADALEKLSACQAQLACSDFLADDLGGYCEDESDSFRVAVDQTIPGGEDLCSASH